MPDVNVQFHMLLEELLDFVADVSRQYALQIQLERFFPKTVYDVPAGADLRAEARKFGDVDRIWLLYTPARCRRAERFSLVVGIMRGRRLQQAALNAGTDKAEAFRVLKKVATALKRRTIAGVWVVAETGTVGYAKEFRVSAGAAAAARAGQMELKNIAFTQRILVDPPG